MSVVVRTRPPPPYPFTPTAGSGSDTATNFDNSIHSSSNSDAEIENHFYSPSRSPSEGNDPLSYRENVQPKTPHSTALGSSGKDNPLYVPVSVHRRVVTKLDCSEKALEQLQLRHAESLKGLHGEVSRLQDVCATLSAQVMEGRCVENKEEVQESKKDAEEDQTELIQRLRIECGGKQREIDRLVQEIENVTLQLSHPATAENANGVSDERETVLNSRKANQTVIMRGRRYGSTASLSTTGPMVPYPPDTPHHGPSHPLTDGAEPRSEAERFSTSDEVSNRTLPTPRSTLPPIKSSSQSKLCTRAASERLLNLLGGSKSSLATQSSSGSSQTILPEIHSLRGSGTLGDPASGSSGQLVPSRSAAALASVPLKKAISRRFSLRPKRKEEA